MTTLLTTFFIILFSTFLFSSVHAADKQCSDNGVVLQVLGSGGPEIDDNRTSTSYLIWVDGNARVLIDAGGGSAWRFEQSGARFEDLEAMLFTHLHVDHVADLPVYVKSSFFTERNKDLDLYGPGSLSDDDVLPAFDDFIERLFSRKHGAYPYLSAHFNQASSNPFHYLPQTIEVKGSQVQVVSKTDHFTLSTVPVMHGLLPALAWRVDVHEGDNKASITISGDMNGRKKQLDVLAKDSDLLVAHTAINEQTQGAGAFLHMKPSTIGEIAHNANAQQLLLSHFMKRSLNRDQAIRDEVKNHYQGELHLAEDLSCWPVKSS